MWKRTRLFIGNILHQNGTIIIEADKEQPQRKMQKKIESHAKGSADNLKPDGVFTTDPKTISDCLSYWAERKPNEDAIVFHSTIEPRYAVSWKELYERSHKMAMTYIKMGIQPGEIIAIASRPCPEWLYVVYGAMAAGIMVTSIVFTYSDGSDAVAMMQKLQKCALLVMDPGLKETNWSIFKQLINDYDCLGRVSSTEMPYLRNLIFVMAPVSTKVATVSNLLREDCSAEIPPVDPHKLALNFQTSGSTGVPKLVAFTQTAIVTFVKAMGASGGFFGPKEFNDRPFGWIGGFPFGLLIGQTRVTVSGLCQVTERIPLLIDVIKREGCASTIMLPPMIYELTKKHEELPPGWPLETILTGGQPIAKSLTTCLGKVCSRLCVVYGGTEFFAVTRMDVESAERFVDYSSGLPEHGVEVKVVDKMGNTLPVGERGEIYIRNEWLFQEYLNDADKTAAAKTIDGWYKTDDYGRMNADGFLFVEGRISDIILSGGMNVTPAILEAVLKTYPGVESAIVVPVPHKELYQVVCACVTLKTGHTDVTETQLREFMQQKHNDEEKLFTVLPEYYLFLDKLPEETTGKISRKTLKQMAKEKYCN